MLPENHVVLDMDDIHDIFMVVLPQILQDLELNARLVIVLLLVLHDLDGDVLLLLVVDAPERRAEGALAQELDYLIPVPDVITDDDLVITFVIVVPIVMNKLAVVFLLSVAAAALVLFDLLTREQVGLFWVCLLILLIHLFLPTVAQEVYHIIVQYLAFLIVSQLIDVVPQNVLRRGRQRGLHLVLGGHRAETEGGVDEASWDVLNRRIEVHTLQ